MRSGDGFFIYVSRHDSDPSLFIGHVMFQVSPGVISSRMVFQGSSYQEARDVAQFVCNYLNGCM